MFSKDEEIEVTEEMLEMAYDAWLDHSMNEQAPEELMMAFVDIYRAMVRAKQLKEKPSEEG